MRFAAARSALRRNDPSSHDDRQYPARPIARNSGEGGPGRPPPGCSPRSIGDLSRRAWRDDRVERGKLRADRHWRSARPCKAVAGFESAAHEFPTTPSVTPSSLSHWRVTRLVQVQSSPVSCTAESRWSTRTHHPDRLQRHVGPRAPATTRRSRADRSAFLGACDAPSTRRIAGATRAHKTRGERLAACAVRWTARCS